MRTLVDLEDTQVQELDAMAGQAKQSRASLIRQAIAEFLGRRRRDTAKDAFGLWGDREIDGMAYQRDVRAEW